jgi:integrase
MPKVKLTDAAVRRFKAPRGGRVDYFDAILPSFACRVSGPTPGNPEGHKSWVLFYRFGGKQKRLTIEPAYPALGLKDARRKAGEVLQKLAMDIDPAAEKKARAARPPDTIENIIDEFIKRHMEAKERAPRYIVETRRNFDNHVLPRWRGREMRSITRREVIELLDTIADQGKPVAANRVLAAIRKLFNWAIGRGIIESSPVAMIERPGAEISRDRALKPDELRAVWIGAGKLPYPFGAYFRMCLMTGQRRTEVAGMRWADIDENTWTIPSTDTKSGRAHAVPLSVGAIEIVDSCHRIGAYVFTTRANRPISGFSKAKQVLDAAIEEPVAAWRIHDLRRSVASGMGKLGIARFTIARVLNHADRSVTGIYDRYEYLAEKRHALDAWGAYVGNLITPAPDKVINLRQAQA